MNSRVRAVAVGAVALLAVCGGGVASSGPASAQLGAAKQQNITLKSLKFTPNKVTVAKGTKVQFVWKEQVAHNVVFEKNGPKSKTFNKGVWDLDPKLTSAPGTYKYKCTLHPGMNGQITVK